MLAEQIRPSDFISLSYSYPIVLPHPDNIQLMQWLIAHPLERTLTCRSTTVRGGFLEATDEVFAVNLSHTGALPLLLRH